MITIYGIKNCDTCRKARKWLDAQGIGHDYHDFREDGLDKKSLTAWVEAVGWETLLNRRGTILLRRACGDQFAGTPGGAKARRETGR